MRQVLAFDVYGTLVDTASVAARLRELVGDKADAFAQVWRDKQLEYTFRRALMDRYEPFPVCVRDALDFTCARLDAPLSGESRRSLLDAYRVLPVFDDVVASLEGLAASGFGLYAFSNGPRASIEMLLDSAGIRDRFEDIVSVDEIGTFKPSPVVYHHFLSRAGVAGTHAWLVSGNPFDVMGAIAAGLRGVWVRRSRAAVYDPWDIEPTLTIARLDELAAGLASFGAGR